MAPSGASASFGASRRSMRPVGRCQQSETTLSPATFSISLPRRGPMPGSDVTEANRGKRIWGRKGREPTTADKRVRGFYILRSPMSPKRKPDRTVVMCEHLADDSTHSPTPCGRLHVDQERYVKNSPSPCGRGQGEGSRAGRCA